jgi:hypothetical protein
MTLAESLEPGAKSAKQKKGRHQEVVPARRKRYFFVLSERDEVRTHESTRPVMGSVHATPSIELMLRPLVRLRNCNIRLWNCSEVGGWHSRPENLAELRDGDSRNAVRVRGGNELQVPHEFTNQVQHRTKVLRWKKESMNS